MFTGLVEEVGTIVAINRSTGDANSAAAQVTVRAPQATSDAAHGDSIAVSGVCLTVVALDADTFTVELMAETLNRTSARDWQPGTGVNIERSLLPTTRLGGHIVQGHVDGVGHVILKKTQPGFDDVHIRVPAALGRFIAPQGAVAVDGISLTIIDVTDTADGTEFSLGIIPETRQATTMGQRNVGDTVNIEVDVMAKYAARLLATEGTN